jgi:hypothetical protein
VAATTYGDSETAERLCRIVRRTHRRITGIAPDGRPYDANDPALLRWVHVAEVSMFAAANARYGRRVMTPAELDAYYDEMAVVAEALGATDLPRSSIEMADYFTDVQPELAGGDQAQDTLRFLANPSGGRPGDPQRFRHVLGRRLGNTAHLGASNLRTTGAGPDRAGGCGSFDACAAGNAEGGRRRQSGAGAGHPPRPCDPRLGNRRLGPPVTAELPLCWGNRGARPVT